MWEDEDLIYAQKLQAQFDQEARDGEDMEKNDRAVARAVAKVHTHSISDSEDSDATVDPQERSFNNSQDLFDDSTEESSSTPAKSKTEPDSLPNPYEVDTDVEEQEKEKPSSKKKPMCKYGSKCYRKNPSHLEEFHHPRKRSHTEQNSKPSVPIKVKKKDSYMKTVADVVEEMQPFSFFLTKVAHIPSQYNTTGALSLKDLLSQSMGTLKQSCQFNYMFEIEWLVSQYPEPFRKLPLLLVHGEKGRDELNLKAEASEFSHISFCRAPLDCAFGTHHTKMMFLLYTDGLRIVIHTSNLVSNDWHQKSQGMWVSPVFPPLKSTDEKGDSLTGFKTDLLSYLNAYKNTRLAQWEKIIQQHDMKRANVFLIGSVPGRHTLNTKHEWGHLKLRKVLTEHGPDPGLTKHWPLVSQFSSIGSLGATPEAWLLSEFGLSLSACRETLVSELSKNKCHLIFPSLNNIRLSLEGYSGGGCVPYRVSVASKQRWLTDFFCQWKSEGRGRSKAVPHIKTYSRFSPDGTQAAWFLLTSANLSKAAWGALEKKGSQLAIRSYELGVLFLPQFFGCKNSFGVSSRLEDVLESGTPVFPLPYELPPSEYVKGDRPWFIDVPSVDLPDTFGRKWCPQL